MWDSCWIALASGKAEGRGNVVEGGKGKPANSTGIDEEGIVAEGFCRSARTVLSSFLSTRLYLSVIYRTFMS